MLKNYKERLSFQDEAASVNILQAEVIKTRKTTFWVRSANDKSLIGSKKEAWSPESNRFNSHGASEACLGETLCTTPVQRPSPECAIPKKPSYVSGSTGEDPPSAVYTRKSLLGAIIDLCGSRFSTLKSVRMTETARPRLLRACTSTDRPSRPSIEKQDGTPTSETASLCGLIVTEAHWCHRVGPGWGKIATMVRIHSDAWTSTLLRDAESLSQLLLPHPQPNAPMNVGGRVVGRADSGDCQSPALCSCSTENWAISGLWSLISQS